MKMKEIVSTSSKVLLYVRVSTDEQAQQGYSLDYQEETLRTFCKRMNYQVIAVFREDHSAKNFKRPEWSRLQTFLKTNKRLVDKVLFTKWDRFSRNIHDAFTEIKKLEYFGIEPNAVEQWLESENQDRVILLSFYLSIGEAERAKIASRTKDGTYQAKKEGYYASRAPYGYDSQRDGAKSTRGSAKGKRSILVPNSMAPFVTKAFKQVALSVEPVEATRKRLYSEGMTLKKSSFNEMLKNIVYAGKIIVPEYKKEVACVVNAIHEPLIDLATFNKVQDLFRKGRWYGLKPSNRNEDFPLRDFLTCENCGRQITGSLSTGRSKRYAYYHCRENCKTRVQSAKAHERFASLLVNLQINRNVKNLFSEILKNNEAQINGDRKKSVKIKMDRKQLLISNLNKADDLLMSGTLSSERYNSMVERYNSELMEINMEIEILQSSCESIVQYIDNGLEMLANLDTLFIESDYDGKRILAGSLFTEKLIFGNEGCRTAEVNAVIDVLTRVDAGLNQNKKRKAAIADSFSVKVPGAGLEPARFPTGV
jgi:site-specific DNA recombinase